MSDERYAKLSAVLPPQLVRLIDQSRNTLEALRRGEEPPCPWCGAPCEGKYENWFLNGEAIWRFACGSNVQRVMRSDTCYERELDRLRAECEDLRGLVCTALKYVVTDVGCYCTKAGKDPHFWGLCQRCVYDKMLAVLRAALGEKGDANG